jgi:hypothetical protein
VAQLVKRWIGLITAQARTLSKLPRRMDAFGRLWRTSRESSQ